jgi:hypothetical protein
MEPLNDQELDQILREWQARDMPAALERKVFGAHRWPWLLRGSIRVPVPVGILMLLLLGLAAYSSFSIQRPVTLSDFQPVKQLEPRIIRTVYENH